MADTEDPNIATLRDALDELRTSDVSAFDYHDKRARAAIDALASTLAERDEALDGLRRQLAEKDAGLRSRLRSEALRALETLEQTSQLFDEDSYYALRARIEKGEF